MAGRAVEVNWTRKFYNLCLLTFWGPIFPNSLVREYFVLPITISLLPLLYIFNINLSLPPPLLSCTSDVFHLDFVFYIHSAVFLSQSTEFLRISHFGYRANSVYTDMDAYIYVLVYSILCVTNNIL